MNRLSEETSPYLLQHAGNPVDWQPWDDTALAAAKKQNKPILLSIGFSANHLCQVMAKESFESTQVAKLINDSFIPIKVDREERPDLDRVYQAAHQLLNRKPGGWPLTMFVDPNDHLPLFGGTYFPPQAQRDVPSFREVLKGMAKTFSQPNDKMDEFKSKFAEALAAAPGHAGPSPINPQLIDRACGQIDSSFDAKRGGFSEAPKYPHASGLNLMLDAAACTDEAEKSDRLYQMFDFTAMAMARGGIFDHLGGGFHRYSVDAYWDIPRFEKTLYDNGLLLSVYAVRAKQTQSTLLGNVATRLADWLINDMQLADGGFCASTNSALDGQEGRYYVWSSDELFSELGDDFKAFAEVYELNKRKPNFGTDWHLRQNPPTESSSVDDAPPEASIEALRQRVLELRNKRDKPSRDDKVLSGWNALAIRGLTHAANCLGRDDYLTAASAALDFLRQTHWQDGKLLSYSRDSVGSREAYLADYAYVLDAVIAVLAAQWSDENLRFAIALGDSMLTQFEDPDQGGFYFTGHEQEALIQRAKPFTDDALPSANGVAISALLELSHLCGDGRYAAAAERALAIGMSEAERWPSAHATVLRGQLDATQPATRVVLRTGDDKQGAAWKTSIMQNLDHRSRCYVIPTSCELVRSESHADVDPAAAVAAFIYRGDELVAATDKADKFEQLLAAG